MARCCVTEIQGPVEPSGAPRGRNQTRTVGNFLFAQTVISRRHAFLFIHQPTMPPPRRCEGVGLLFLSRCQTFFRFDRERCCSCSWSFFSLVLYSHSFALFCRSLRSLLDQSFFVHSLTPPLFWHFHTHQGLWDTPPTQNHPSIKKGPRNLKSPPPTPQPSKETPKHPKNPPETKPKCPPSAPS